MIDFFLRFNLRSWCFLAGLLALMLLPWWHNHSYLRDLYDYGLVIAANGHMDRGERPYVDFTTPIQAGFLGLNWLVEKAGGGTYEALTRGAAGLILASALVLPLMLVRRWPWWAALVLGGTVTAASAAQHTILWHNTLGVFCLALVAWSAAVAPVLRRVDWPWHLLAGVGLVLGGINKLNFQLVALAVVVAWALRAGWLERAGWRLSAATILAALGCGVMLPIGLELWWTGASMELWLANVVGTAADSRLDQLKEIWSADFLLRPVHDYYGPQVLPQAGMIGLLLSVATLVGCWPTGGQAGGRCDRLLLPLAVLLAGLAGAALLVTNFEIISIGLTAWLVLLTSIWLGFAPPAGRVLFNFGFVVPAGVIGLAAWWSAWLGQRSQFGYSTASRSEYQPAEKAAPAYASLRGLRLPPEFVLSLEALSHILAEGGDQPRLVFYGAGLELLDRYFPAKRERRQPLWAHWGTSYDAGATRRLSDAFMNSDSHRMAFANVASAHWPDEVRAVLEDHFVRDMVGPTVARWRHRDDATANLADSFEALRWLGGNLDSRVLHFDRHPLRIRRTSTGQLILGTNLPEGQVLVRTPSYRLKGKAVVARMPGAGNGPLAADFKVIVHGASPEDVRWSAHVEVPAGQESAEVPFHVDGSGRLLMLWVMRPAEQSNGLLAGYRDLEITHAAESPIAPRLRPNSPAEVALTPEHVESLLGGVAWRPNQLAVRAGHPAAEGVELLPGGEIWMHTEGMVGELQARVTCLEGGMAPVVRIVWYKGGRLQIIQQEWVRHDAPVDLRVWTAEPGGWIGILADSGAGFIPVNVRVTGTTLTP